MKSLQIVTLLLLVGGCATFEDGKNASVSVAIPEADEYTEPTPSASSGEALAAAAAAIEVASQKRNVWMTSVVLLKQAQSAAENGDEESAIRLADEARIHAELAAKQADTEKIDWRTRVLEE